MNKFMSLAHYFIALFGFIFMTGMYWDKVQAYDGRITMLENQIIPLPKIQQRVDDIAEFLGVPRKSNN